MQQQNHLGSALVIVIEGLATGLVGAYGTSTSLTPGIDRLAAEGVLLDQCFVDSQELLLQAGSLWNGRHAMQAGESDWSLWRRFSSDTGHVARLLTDSQQVADLAPQFGCESVTLIKSGSRESAADETSACGLMVLFAAAADEIATGRPGLVWVHSRGLRLPWDAPLFLRQEFADPEDPMPPNSIHVPEMDVGESTDPDLIVGWGQVAAAQAAVVDEAVSALLETVAGRADAADWSYVVASLGGTPLGEHGRLGGGRPQLHGEELHCVAIVRPAPSLVACPVGLRRPELFQLPDVAVTIASLLTIEPEPGSWGQNLLMLGAAESPLLWPAAHSLAMISTPRLLWIRSPAWSALLNAPDFLASTELSALGESGDCDFAKLFVKPEDRWEVGEIADRRREVVARHRELANVFRRATEQSDRTLLPVLDDVLCNLLR